MLLSVTNEFSLVALFQIKFVLNIILDHSTAFSFVTFMNKYQFDIIFKHRHVPYYRSVDVEAQTYKLFEIFIYRV